MCEAFILARYLINVSMKYTVLYPQTTYSFYILNSSDNSQIITKLLQNGIMALFCHFL